MELAENFWRVFSKKLDWLIIPKMPHVYGSFSGSKSVIFKTTECTCSIEVSVDKFLYSKLPDDFFAKYFFEWVTSRTAIDKKYNLYCPSNISFVFCLSVLISRQCQEMHRAKMEFIDVENLRKPNSEHSPSFMKHVEKMIIKDCNRVNKMPVLAGRPVSKVRSFIRPKDDDLFPIQ